MKRGACRSPAPPYPWAGARERDPKARTSRACSPAFFLLLRSPSEGSAVSVVAERVNRRAVLSELGIGLDALRRLERTKALRPQKQKSPKTGLPEKTYDPADVARVKAAREAPPPDRIKRPEGDYIPSDEARRRLGFKKRSV